MEEVLETSPSAHPPVSGSGRGGARRHTTRRGPPPRDPTWTVGRGEHSWSDDRRVGDEVGDVRVPVRVPVRRRSPRGRDTVYPESVFLRGVLTSLAGLAEYVEGADS